MKQEKETKNFILEIVRETEVAKSIREYMIANIWDDCYKNTRISAALMLAGPSLLNFTLYLLKGRIARKPRIAISVAGVLATGLLHLDSIRRDSIKFALKDPVMFQKMSLVIDMRNVVIESEYKRMEKLIKGEN